VAEDSSGVRLLSANNFVVNFRGCFVLGYWECGRRFLSFFFFFFGFLECGFHAVQGKFFFRVPPLELLGFLYYEFVLGRFCVEGWMSVEPQIIDYF